MRRGWKVVFVLWVPWLALGCLPPSGLEQQIRLESTVVAMQTDVAMELSELRGMIATAAVPPTALLLPISTPAMPTSTPTGVSGPALGGVVTADVLNVRKGPGLGYKVVGHLQKGDVLQARARVEAGDWMKISTADGIEGWVAVEHVALNVPLDSIPLAVEIPPTPVPGPTTPAPGPTARMTPTATVASSEG